MVSLLTLVELSIVEGMDNRGPRLLFFEEEWMEELLLDASAVVARVVEVRREAGMVGNVPTLIAAASKIVSKVEVCFSTTKVTKSRRKHTHKPPSCNNGFKLEIQTVGRCWRRCSFV